MRDIPFWPRALGLAGLLPALLCVGAALAGPEEWRAVARMTGALYAAVIFTFLGGTWWGMAAAAPAAERRGGLAWAWAASVVPSLAAWGLLAAWSAGLIPLEPVLVMLGAGILIALAVDARVQSIGPRWWMALRVPLSLILGGATLALALI